MHNLICIYLLNYISTSAIVLTVTQICLWCKLSICLCSNELTQLIVNLRIILKIQDSTTQSVIFIDYHHILPGTAVLWDPISG